MYLTGLGDRCHDMLAYWFGNTSHVYIWDPFHSHHDEDINGSRVYNRDLNVRDGVFKTRNQSVSALSLSSMMYTLNHSHLALLVVSGRGVSLEMVREWRRSGWMPRVEQIMLRLAEPTGRQRKDEHGVREAVENMMKLGFEMIFQEDMVCMTSSHIHTVEIMEEGN